MNILPQADRAALLLRSEMRPTMAKADVRKPDMRNFRVDVGRAIQRATNLSGWSLKELAGRVNRDPRQVARWIAGIERPHLDALFALEEFQRPLLMAFAELAEEGVEIETVIRMKRAVTT